MALTTLWGFTFPGGNLSLGLNSCARRGSVILTVPFLQSKTAPKASKWSMPTIRSTFSIMLGITFAVTPSRAPFCLMWFGNTTLQLLLCLCSNSVPVAPKLTEMSWSFATLMLCGFSSHCVSSSADFLVLFSATTHVQSRWKHQCQAALCISDLQKHL